MGWALDNTRPARCPCGSILRSAKGLEIHLRVCHPGLTDRERSELVHAFRSDAVVEAVRKILREGGAGSHALDA